MLKIGIFGSSHTAQHRDRLKAFFDELAKFDCHLYYDAQFLNTLQGEFALSLQVNGKIETGQALDLDVALSLGGDGTFLRTAHQVGSQSIPILGINLGRLGFLTDMEAAEATPLIHRLFEQSYSIEERSQLSVEVDGKFFGDALNDVALLKRETGSMIRIQTHLDSDHLADYECDGLVVATPTGSTAYSLSVSGPLMMPESNCTLLAPIAPHSLTMRPLVVPDKTVISMAVSSRSSSFLLVIDGQTKILPIDAQVRLRRSVHTIRIMHLQERPFSEVLKQKLLWAASVRD